MGGGVGEGEDDQAQRYTHEASCDLNMANQG